MSNERLFGDLRFPLPGTPLLGKNEMQITVRYCVLSVVLSAGMLAQTSVFDHLPQRLSVSDQVERLTAEAEAERAAFDRAKLESETFRRYQFAKKASEFVNSWNEFAKSYSEGKVDLKEARELSKRFHELEKKGGWLEQDKNKSVRLACPSLAQSAAN